MLRLIRLTLACVLALSLSPLSLARAQPGPLPCQTGALPTGDPQHPEQLIMICVPPTGWNGQLVVYAHGYVPAQAPLALPLGELTLPEPITLPDGTLVTSVPEVLLSIGFAFATSSYSKNGYAVQQAGDNLNALVDYFRTLPLPDLLQKVFIVGASEGGLITTMLLEKYPDRYTGGGLALCGPVGGTPFQVKYLGDFRVVFDAFFEEVFNFGAAEVPTDAFQAWETRYVPAIMHAFQTRPHKVEQLFNVTGAALDPQDPAGSVVTTSLGVLFYSVFGTNDLIATAGGQAYDNQFTVYQGAKSDVALNARIERVTGALPAQSYIGNFYQTTGALQRPLVLLNNTLDPAVPFAHVGIYNSLVANAGRSAFLTSLPAARYGHCNFTVEELLGAFGLLILQSTGQMQPAFEQYLPALPAPYGQ